MLPADAAKLLDLPTDATPEQLEARFNELRAKLEDKIAKAPTPGLKAKYRESLDEITAAFETLTLAADSSSLPVAQRTGPTVAGVADPGAARAAPQAPGSATPATAPRRKSGGKEFLVVALIAVLALGAGGWWVIKAKAENEEKSRIAAEMKAEADRQAAAEKVEAERKAEDVRIAAEVKKKTEEEEKARVAAAEKTEQERREKLLASLRSRLAELNVTAEALFRDEPSKAGRKLSDVKSDERSLSRDASAFQQNKARAQLAAQQTYVDQVETLLARHPAKLAQARAAEMLSARQPTEAEAALGELAGHLEAIEQALVTARQQADQTMHAALRVGVDGQYGEVAWTLTDAFGENHSGTGSRQLDRVAPGAAEIIFTRPGWPQQKIPVIVRAKSTNEVRAAFTTGMLKLTSAPSGAKIQFSNGTTGTTPATFSIVPGNVGVSLQLAGYQPTTFNVIGEAGIVVSQHTDLQPVPLLTDAELARYIATLPVSNVVSDVPYATWRPVRAEVPGPMGRENVAIGLLTFRSLDLEVTQSLPVAPASWFERSAASAPQAQANQRDQRVARTLMGGLMGAIAQAQSPAQQPTAATSPFDTDGHGYVVVSGLVNRSTLAWFARPKIEQASNPALAEACVDWLMRGVQFRYTGEPAPFHVLVQVVVKYRNPSK